MADVSLQPFPDDWQDAVAIVAHPDDLEYGVASAVARWTSDGKRVSYVLATSGEAGIDGVDPALCGPMREEEERRGASIVGVEHVEFLGFPDGLVVEGLDDDSFDPDRFLRGSARAAGEAARCAYAVTFQRFPA